MMTDFIYTFLKLAIWTFIWR